MWYKTQYLFSTLNFSCAPAWNAPWVKKEAVEEERSWGHNALFIIISVPQFLPPYHQDFPGSTGKSGKERCQVRKDFCLADMVIICNRVLRVGRWQACSILRCSGDSSEILIWRFLTAGFPRHEWQHLCLIPSWLFPLFCGPFMYSVSMNKPLLLLPLGST